MQAPYDARLGELEEERGLQHGTAHRCPECGGEEIGTDAEVGERFCMGCGYVIDYCNIDPDSRASAFNREEWEEKERATPLPSVYAGARTLIDWSNSGLGADAAREANMLRRLSRRSGVRGSREKNLSKAVDVLRRLSDKLSMPDIIVNEADRVYRMALKKGMNRRRSMEGLVVASLCVATKVHKHPMPLSEIRALSTENKHALNTNYRRLIRLYESAEGAGEKTPVRSAEEYLGKITCASGVSSESEMLAKEILMYASRKKITNGKNPLGMAAAAVYMACQFNKETGITQGELAEAAKVSEVTLINRYKELEEKLPPIEDILKAYNP